MSPLAGKKPALEVWLQVWRKREGVGKGGRLRSKSISSAVVSLAIPKPGVKFCKLLYCNLNLAVLCGIRYAAWEHAWDKIVSGEQQQPVNPTLKEQAVINWGWGFFWGEKSTMVTSDNRMVLWNLRAFFRNSDSYLRREGSLNYNLDIQKRDLGWRPENLELLGPMSKKINTEA